MAIEKAVPQHEPDKNQGDKLEHVVDSLGERSSKEQGHEQSDSGQQSTHPNNPIPPAEHGGHARSQAAHLKETEHLHGAGLQGDGHHQPAANFTGLREPPQEVTRVGKRHRKQ